MEPGFPVRVFWIYYLPTMVTAGCKLYVLALAPSLSFTAFTQRYITTHSSVTELIVMFVSFRIMSSEVDEKVELLFRAVGDAPVLKKNKFKLSRLKTILFVNHFLTKATKCEGEERIFLYIHQSFSPLPSAEIGMLFDNYNRKWFFIYQPVRHQILATVRTVPPIRSFIWYRTAVVFVIKNR